MYEETFFFTYPVECNGAIGLGVILLKHTKLEKYVDELRVFCYVLFHERYSLCGCEAEALGNDRYVCQHSLDSVSAL